MDKESLIKFYELHVSEDLKNFEIYRSQVKFFTGLIGVFVAASAAGLVKIPTQYHFILIIAVSILIIIISEYSINATDTGYRRWLETVTVRAKLEYLLGFTTKVVVPDLSEEFKWKDEPIIPNRHIRDRNEFDSSEEFVEKRMKMGSHLWVVRLFRVFQISSVGLLLTAIYIFKK
jgi:hypothetical protein